MKRCSWVVKPALCSSCEKPCSVRVDWASLWSRWCMLKAVLGAGVGAARVLRTHSPCSQVSDFSACLLSAVPLRLPHYPGLTSAQSCRERASEPGAREHRGEGSKAAQSDGITLLYSRSHSPSVSQTRPQTLPVLPGSHTAHAQAGQIHKKVLPQSKHSSCVLVLWNGKMQIGHIFFTWTQSGPFPRCIKLVSYEA